MGHLYILTVGGILPKILTQPFLLMLSNQLIIHIVSLVVSNICGLIFAELVHDRVLQMSQCMFVYNIEFIVQIFDQGTCVVELAVIGEGLVVHKHLHVVRELRAKDYVMRARTVG